VTDVATVTDRVAEAYTWGLPLVTMHRTRARHPPAALGRLVPRDRLAAADDRSVVAPNHDTLYASGWFDLADGDLEVEVGPIDRYWSVMLLDAHTHVRYVCRRLHGCQGASVRVTFDPDGGAPEDVATSVVAMPNRTVWALVRVVVDGPDDVPAAQAALREVVVRQPGRHHEGGTVPADRRADGFLAELGAALRIDPPAPWQPAPPPGLEELLARPPAGDVVEAGLALGKEQVAAGLGMDRIVGGWGTRSRGADFGDDVAYRAAFTAVSLAGHLPQENRGYRQSLDGSRPVQLHFTADDLPPVRGFWSLTVYGPDLFLVVNELGRHAVGDRTLVPAADGSITVTVAADPPDDIAGWLPAPAGPYHLVLRAYEGAPEVVDATWFPPEPTHLEDPTR
jgi:hypothetical protein